MYINISIYLFLGDRPEAGSRLGRGLVQHAPEPQPTVPPPAPLPRDDQRLPYV